MTKSPWHQFTLRIPIQSTVTHIYQAWTTSAGIESWFLRKCIFFDENGSPLASNQNINKGTYSWFWHGHGDEVNEKNKIHAGNGKDFFQFGFEGCIVKIEIEETTNGAMLTLTQEDIHFEENPSENLYVQCGFGWTFYLTNLKSILEGGIDLRNKDMAVKNVVNA